MRSCCMSLPDGSPAETRGTFLLFISIPSGEAGRNDAGPAGCSAILWSRGEASYVRECDQAFDRDTRRFRVESLPGDGPHGGLRVGP